MKHLVLVLVAMSNAVPLYAQESVTIKEPAEQCYQDLKSNLPEAVGWDDAHMTVTSMPVMTTLSGSAYVVARILTEFEQDKKTKEKMQMCKIVVAIDDPEHSMAWNAMNSSRLRQLASLMKARIESTIKSRNKKGD